MTYRNILLPVRNTEGFEHIPLKPVSHSNVARVLLMIAHILPIMISFWATYQINMSPTVNEIRI